MKKKFIAILILVIVNYKLYAYNFTTIDSLIYASISNKSFPGAQLLIGNNKEIIYTQNYGHYTYDANSPFVEDSSLFDLASLTKVIATTTAIMKLYEDGKIDLNDKAVKYIPEMDNNGKNEITIRNLLQHNSGLKAWIPFYKTCKDKFDVLNVIYNSNLDYPTETKFVYSDLNAILLGIIIERISNTTLEEFCQTNFFKPLKMNNTTFILPQNKKKLALPTEYDTYWRMKLIQGEVHDEAASLLNGVSGNAGLFSNVMDLYQLTKMLLNKGIFTDGYSGSSNEKRIFSESTINLFLQRFDACCYNNTRALGWDTKPQPISYRPPCGELISENCFGHTGFTGTSIWVDMDKNLIIIFLTNRVYPNRDNNSIREIRPELHNKIISIINN